MPSYVYIASPYSHQHKDVVHDRAYVTLGYTTKLMEQKEIVFSPIIHCHPIAELGNLPGDFEFWKHYNEAMISGAHELRVLMMPGWEKSKGVQAEIAIAEKLGIEVTYVDWEDIKDNLVFHPCVGAAVRALEQAQ